MTINEAIKEAMRIHGGPMTIRETYDAIVGAGLYTFHAENPVHVVASQLRRHCKGLDFPSASETKYFELHGDDKYYFLDQPVRQPGSGRIRIGRDTSRSLLRNLKAIHQRYQAELRLTILSRIRRLHPSTFEDFAKRLLDAYGFLEMKVTQYCKDGGIDGHGKLKVGLAHLNVAFQCKRFNHNTIGRPEIDKFRGAIQGAFEQGIFFTTSKFARGAEAASFRPGAVPIILIDGNAIVHLMIEKQFGVQVEQLPIYSYALDLVFSEDVEDAKLSTTVTRRTK
jgi:restriction system protein